MEGKSTPPTTDQKSEYTQRIEVVAKELIDLVNSRKDESSTGIIIISVNTEKGADKDEVVLSMAGTGKALRLGLRLFSEKDPDMKRIFESVVIERILYKQIEKMAEG